MVDAKPEKTFDARYCLRGSHTTIILSRDESVLETTKLEEKRKRFNAIHKRMTSFTWGR